MRKLLLAAVTATLALAAQDAREIMRRAVEAGQHNENVARNYVFVERVDQRTLDGQGRVKKTEIKTYDVTLSEGTPYERLIEIDDKPLSPDVERKEQEKLRKNMEERKKESPDQRAKRLADWEKQRKKNRAFWDEVLEGVDFRLAGEEDIGGRKAWILDATPHPGYRARSREAGFLAKVRGKLWIDQQDYMAARIEAEPIDDISFAGFLGKVYKGTRIRIDQVPVNGEVWLPKRVEARIAARILISKLRRNLDVSYRDYRKFQVDARIVETDVQHAQ